MVDWNGTTEFVLDGLGRITEATDHGCNVTLYGYDEAGNRASTAYPDGTAASYEYDLLDRLVALVDAEGEVTAYSYDAARLTGMSYPNGWSESYSYNAKGWLTGQAATDPTNTPSKTVTHTHEYDVGSNIERETRSGAGGQDAFDRDHEYDALGRLVKTTAQIGQKDRNYDYFYDSLGNLVYEKNANWANKGNEYWHNGFGDLVANEWVIAKNAYGYTGTSTSPTEQVGGVVVCDRHWHSYGFRKTSTAVIGFDALYHALGGGGGPDSRVAEYVVGEGGGLEFVSEESFSLNSALQEHDYGTGEFNPAVMYILKLHHHQDRLGVTDYLTAGKDGKAMGYVTYDDWGALTAKAVLNCRLRQLDLVQDYTGHPYDQVLAAYYAPSKGWLHYSAEADSSLDDYFAGMAEMPPDPSFVPRLTALVNLQEFIDHMRKFGFDYPIIQYDGGTWYADDSFSKTIGSVPTMVVIVPGYLVREYFEKYICNNPLGSGQLTAIAANVIANGIETWLFGKKEKLAFASFYTRILRGSTGSEKEVLRDKTPYNETPYKRLV